MHNLDLLNSSVISLVSRPPVICKADTKVHEVVSMMVKNKIGSVVVVDEQEIPLGIVTDKDLRNKVLAHNLGTEIPVESIMSKPVVTISTETIAFEALRIMMKNDIHHLPVVNKTRRIKGVISSHDLMLLSTPHPIAFIREIGEQNSLEGLSFLFKQTSQVAASLLRSGLNMYHLCLLITEIHDHIIRKILELTTSSLIQEKGIKDLSEHLCWLVFGSEGRREQTLITDQDNGIVFSNIPIEIANSFGDKAVNYLLQCGYPICSGGIMANQPNWCRSISSWEKALKKWIINQNENTVIWLTVIADLRPIWGNFSLAKDLYHIFVKTIKSWRGIFRNLAQTALINAPSNFLEWFAAQRASGGRNLLNIKLYGISAIVNGIRLYALMEDIEDKNTWQRLNKLKEKGVISEQDAQDLLGAFDFLMRIRLQHQLKCVGREGIPDNIIDLRELSSLEYGFLKGALKAINRFQAVLREKFYLSPII
ncbi:MAG TPA: CBS domain-containing protein [Candidatus Desulfofervidus auxilii]|uniref:CBS domain-containing protein n=1 Tax=Desulfofervidus auxilii TaxID=1621989 RepID=A0A7C1ZSP5_DESA2|nr:CBS domain-containing protein [Candidatus Desulfofervidus auxilii]